MTSTTPTKRALQLRLQAARMQERTLPDHVRRAYGELPEQPASRRGNEPSPDEIRQGARASLIERGHLTAKELDTIPVDEAIRVALQRQQEQIAALEEQSAQLGDEERGYGDAVSRPPKTLRR